MKRFLVSIVVFVYFFAASGLLLRQHYCMGDLIETQIDFGQYAASEPCADCGMDQGEDSCCESKTKLIKKVQDQKITEVQALSFTGFVADVLPVFSIPRAFQSALQESVLVTDLQKPPPDPLPVFLKNRNLRI
ncbi:MAG: hypothetical protein JNL13_01975 [Chitinophagaceae bacterium]|nr:hypothetical protein [Chitinophagaceae bacterium]